MRVVVVGLMLTVEASPRYQDFDRHSPAWGYFFVRMARLRRTCWLQAHARGWTKKWAAGPFFVGFAGSLTRVGWSV